MSKEPEYVNMKQARELLGVSHGKMWSLVKDGHLSPVTNPLDKRVKLVRRADVLKLLDMKRRAA